MTTLKAPFGSNGDATCELSSKLLVTSLERQGREELKRTGLLINKTQEGKTKKIFGNQVTHQIP